MTRFSEQPSSLAQLKLPMSQTSFADNDSTCYCRNYLSQLSSSLETSQPMMKQALALRSASAERHTSTGR